LSWFDLKGCMPSLILWYNYVLAIIYDNRNSLFLIAKIMFHISRVLIIILFVGASRKKAHATLVPQFPHCMYVIIIYFNFQISLLLSWLEIMKKINYLLPYILAYKSICFGSEKGAPRFTSTYTPDIVPTSWRKHFFGHPGHTTLHDSTQ